MLVTTNRDSNIKVVYLELLKSKIQRH